MKIPLIQTLKLQVALALTIQFILLAGVVGATIYQLNLRKHDYLILNLAGQLRVITQVLVNQSRNYVHRAPRDYPSYYRDLKLYRNDLDSLVANYDKIVTSFKARRLLPELTGRDEPRFLHGTVSPSTNWILQVLSGKTFAMV